MRVTLAAMLTTLCVAAIPTAGSSQLLSAPEPLAVAGRQDDGRVASIAYRLSTGGHSRCSRLVPTLGMVLQHQSQFQLVDRQAMVATYGLDRGPGIAALVAGGPAAQAGLRTGDVVLAINDVPLPAEQGVKAAFNQRRAHGRADQLLSLLESQTQPFALDVVRGSVRVRVDVTPALACPSRVHLARSGQRNAYADGTHVFVTTGLLSLSANDDEIAFVIAHEMAHNILGHATTMQTAGVKRGLGRTLGRSGRIVRRAERDADALAGEMMVDAHYDPAAGAAILRRLGDADLGLKLFSAYDSAGERIAMMQAIAAARREHQ